mmetsp:Transcript_6522/g.28683  ORF Transcript_6522/g.28683 Transcript_6522/m.28683 type:complete len:338 (-) Transcript_6522:730-1743(-)
MASRDELSRLRPQRPRVHLLLELTLRNGRQLIVRFERRRERVAAQQLFQQVQTHAGSKLRHHVTAAVHGDKAQALGVAGDVTAELRPRVGDRERRPEQQRLLVQHPQGHTRGVEEVRALGSAGETGETNRSNRLSGPFVRHTRIGVAVEHDRGARKPRRDVPVEVYHAGRPRRGVLVARPPLARVRPAVVRSRPRLRGRLLDVQRGSNVGSTHPRRHVKVQRPRHVVPDHRARAVQGEVVHPRVAPRLREAVGGGEEESAMRGDALGRINRRVERPERPGAVRKRLHAGSSGVALPPVARLHAGAPRQTRVAVPHRAPVPQRVKVLIRHEAVLVTVP